MSLIFSLDTSLVSGERSAASMPRTSTTTSGGSVGDLINPFRSAIEAAANESMNQQLYGSSLPSSSSLSYKEPLSWFSSPSLSFSSSLSSFTDGSSDSDLSLLTASITDEANNISSLSDSQMISDSILWLQENITSLAMTASDSPEEYDIEVYKNFLEETRFWVQKVFVPILMVIGVIGNSITIMIMTRRRMRSSTNNYLAALAIMDMMYLIFVFILSISHYSISRQEDYYAYWYLRPYFLMFADVCSNSSVWLTVTFTIERFIVVSHPIRGKVWCTESRSRKVILTVFLIGFAWTLPTPFEYVIKETFNAENNSTHYGLDYSDLGSNATYKSVYYWMTSSLFIFVPLILLAIFNSFLIRSVHISRTQRSGMTQATSHSSSPNPPKSYASSGKTSSKVRSVMTTSGGVTSKLETSASGGAANPPPSSSHSSNNQETKITVMLIAVVILFLLCQLPTAVLLIVSSIHEFEEGSRSDYISRGLGNIFNFLVAINSAGNFLLYCFFSQRYRNTFVSLFCPCYKRHMRYFKSGTGGTMTATYSAATTTGNHVSAASSAKLWHRTADTAASAATPASCNISPTHQKVHHHNGCSSSPDLHHHVVEEKEMHELQYDHQSNKQHVDQESDETTPILSPEKRDSLTQSRDNGSKASGRAAKSDSVVVFVRDAA